MNPCGTILVPNNFSPTHQAGESRPPVFHSITLPTAPFSLLCTNKPITATDINWTPFLKMLPQPFFFLSALLYPAPVGLPTRCAACLHMYIPTHLYTQVCAFAHCSVCSMHSLHQIFCPLAQLGFSHQYVSLNIPFQGIQAKNLF